MAKKSAEKAQVAASKVVVRQVRSAAGRSSDFVDTLKALGLGRIGSERQHNGTPAVLGMIRRVSAAVKVYEVR